VKRIIKVEDKFGVDFHRELIKKLKEREVLNSGLHNPLIERLDTGKCNSKLARAISSRLLGVDRLKVLFVIDSEGNTNAAYNNILRHFEKKPRVQRLSIRVVVVEPRHEAWLCIGLGGDREKCRSSPEEVISRIKNDLYNKRRLSDWVRDVEIDYLLNESDFSKYIQEVKWLLEDR
jgi:hypothetical protein